MTRLVDEGCAKRIELGNILGKPQTTLRRVLKSEDCPPPKGYQNGKWPFWDIQEIADYINNVYIHKPRNNKQTKEHFDEDAYVIPHHTKSTRTQCKKFRELYKLMAKAS